MLDIRTILVISLWEIFRSLIFIKFANEILIKNRVSKLSKILGISIFILFNCFSYTYIYQYGYWISNACIVAACIAYLLIFYINNIKEDLIVSFTYYITYWFITYAINSLFDAIDGRFRLPDVIYDYSSTLIALLVIYFLIVDIIPRFMSYKKHKVDINQFALLMFFCLTGFICLMLYNNWFTIIIGVICNVSIVMLSADMNIIRENKDKERLLTERNNLLEAQDKLMKASEVNKYRSYQQSKEAEQQLRRINHDLNHHFNYILSCDNDVDKIREYIIKLKGEVNEIAKFFDTGSSVVDLILQDLCQKTDKLGIKVSIVGGFSNPLAIEPAQISIIFGNLINNAVEGASKTKGDFKSISITFHQDPERGFYLHVANTADLDNLNINDGVFETTKSDNVSHGIGLKSVKKAVRECNGSMKIDTEDGLFNVEINIPIKND